MAGFGGDAKIALLSGFITGMNKREETKKADERREILNRQAEAQMAESRARTANYEDQARHREANQAEAQRVAGLERLRAGMEERANARKQAILDEEMARRLEIMTDAAMNSGQFPEEAGYTRDQVREIMRGANASDIPDLTMIPDTEEETLNRSQIATAIKNEQANALFAQLSRIGGTEAAKRLKQGLRQGDMGMVERAEDDLRAAGYFDQAIQSYRDQETPEQANTKTTRAQVVAEGRNNARAAFQQEGENVGGYYRWLTAQAANAENPVEQELFEAELRELERLMGLEDPPGQSSTQGEQGGLDAITGR